jgi:hypothetical protein
VSINSKGRTTRSGFFGERWSEPNVLLSPDSGAGLVLSSLLAQDAFDVGEVLLYAVRNYLDAGMVLEPSLQQNVVATGLQQFGLLLESTPEIAADALAIHLPPTDLL